MDVVRGENDVNDEGICKGDVRGYGGGVCVVSTALLLLCERIGYTYSLLMVQVQ
jgi:hypothetical protein